MPLAEIYKSEFQTIFPPCSTSLRLLVYSEAPLASVAICKGVKKAKPPGPHDLGGWKKNLGVDLLSHARVRSIMGDEALNYRVRNGVGCTRLSMDAKETSKYRIDREKRSFENTRLTGY